jgi:general L-amino acid transport system permease protein
MSHGNTLRLVVIPQALRVIIPPLASQYLNLTKNSSLAIAIGYMDVVATIGGISLMQTGREMETMIFVLLTYLIISLIISALMNWFNKRMSLTER